MKRYIMAMASFLLLVAGDQVTKQLAWNYLGKGTTFPLLPGVFELRYLQNYGAAFGVLQQQRIPLLLLTGLVLAFLVYVYSRLPGDAYYRPLRIMCVILCAGAVGNMIDRIWHGYVIDFLYFKWIDFPIFNVADCYVVVSAILTALLILFYYKEEDFTFWTGKEKGEGRV